MNSERSNSEEINKYFSLAGPLRGLLANLADTLSRTILENVLNFVNNLTKIDMKSIIDLLTSSGGQHLIS